MRKGLPGGGGVKNKAERIVRGTKLLWSGTLKKNAERIGKTNRAAS
jgi:hypothetical protein